MRCKKDVGQVENIAECQFSDYKTNTNGEKGEKKRCEPAAAAHVRHLLSINTSDDACYRSPESEKVE